MRYNKKVKNEVKKIDKDKALLPELKLSCLTNSEV